MKKMLGENSVNKIWTNAISRYESFLTGNWAKSPTRNTTGSKTGSLTVFLQTQTTPSLSSSSTMIIDNVESTTSIESNLNQVEEG